MPQPPKPPPIPPPLPTGPERARPVKATRIPIERELREIEEALDLLREEGARRADLALLSAVDLCERLLRLLGVPPRTGPRRAPRPAPRKGTPEPPGPGD